MEAALTSLTRRERLRARTLEEITEHALAIVDAAGSDAVTLSAIANAMGMSAPGLYRYFASRDALLDRLMRLVHEQLAEALEREADVASQLSPEKRLRALVSAYRGWALRYPRRFGMVFGEPTARFNDAEIGEDLAMAGVAANRGMKVLITVLTGLHGSATVDTSSVRLDRGLQKWWRVQGEETVSAGVLPLAVLTWTRLHGIVSLELTGAFAAIDIDPELLLESEIAGLVRRWD